MSERWRWWKLCEECLDGEALVRDIDGTWRCIRCDTMHSYHFPLTPAAPDVAELAQSEAIRRFARIIQAIGPVLNPPRR